MCKHCQIVVLHIILGNVHTLFHYRKTIFVHFRIYPHHATHSTILSITLFHSVPLVLILKKCLRGSNLILFPRYSNNFFVISQILFSMLESNVYSIIDSNMFGVTVGENFLFVIGVERFYNCNYAVEEQRLQLGSTYVNNANWDILHAN